VSDETCLPVESRLWKVINDIRDKTTRIDASLTGYMGQVSERCMSREARIAKLEEEIKHKAPISNVADIDARMRAVERRIWIAVGVTAALSSIGTGGIIATLIMRLLS